jgi:pyrroline-5-carboxylate reductase
MPTLAFLGAGRMASALVDGLLAQGAARPDDLVCSAGSGASAETLSRRTGIRRAATAAEAVAGADTVVLAFKPQHLAGIAPSLAPLLAGKLVVSVLAARTLATLAAAFPGARNLVRTMPNTPAAIGAGVTGWCALRPLSADDRAHVLRLLEAVGCQLEVPESRMDALMAVSGCGPAFLFEFVAALRDGGIAAGLPAAEAARLATETVLGAARLLARTAATPEDLRNQVTSPQGTTYAGLQQMAARDFRGTLRETVLAAKARAEELSRGA